MGIKSVNKRTLVREKYVLIQKEGLESFVTVAWSYEQPIKGVCTIFSKNRKVSSIRTPMLIQGRFERRETNLMHFQWEVTWRHGNQPYILQPKHFKWNNG